MLLLTRSGAINSSALHKVYIYCSTGELVCVNIYKIRLLRTNFSSVFEPSRTHEQENLGKIFHGP